MATLFWIICIVFCYFVIGLITACATAKWEGNTLDEVNADDIALPLFFWPFIFIILIGFGICIAVKKLFLLIAANVFKIPAITTPDGSDGESDGSDGESDTSVQNNG